MYNAERSDHYLRQLDIKTINEDTPFESVLMAVTMLVTFYAGMWAIGFIDFLIG